MVQIPLNQPIPLHTFTKEAPGEELLGFEDVVLLATDDNRIYIQTRDRTESLVVLADGRCAFGAQREEFETAAVPDGTCLRSRRTNRLLQFRDGNFYCLGDNHEDAATIVIRNGNGIHPLVWCVGAGVVGAALIPAIGFGAAALVPTAMSTFGTVVAGVGTMHAPLAAGGIAAILQSTSAALLTTSASAGGAVVGAAVGLFTRNADGNEVTTGMETPREGEDIDDGAVDTATDEAEPGPSDSQPAGEFS